MTERYHHHYAHHTESHTHTTTHESKRYPIQNTSVCSTICRPTHAISAHVLSHASAQPCSTRTMHNHERRPPRSWTMFSNIHSALRPTKPRQQDATGTNPWKGHASSSWCGRSRVPDVARRGMSDPTSHGAPMRGTVTAADVEAEGIVM